MQVHKVQVINGAKKEDKRLFRQQSHCAGQALCKMVLDKKNLLCLTKIPNLEWISGTDMIFLKKIDDHIFWRQILHTKQDKIA